MSPDSLKSKTQLVLIALVIIFISYRDSSSSDLAQICTFAYGCNFEEHRQYGVCLDGMCGRRAQFEDLILLSNKEDAFKGTSPDKVLSFYCIKSSQISI